VKPHLTAKINRKPRETLGQALRRIEATYRAKQARSAPPGWGAAACAPMVDRSGK